MNSSEKNYHFT